MRWLIDSDVLIEGERENPAFLPWLESQEEVATADIVRAESLPKDFKAMGCPCANPLEGASA